MSSVVVVLPVLLATAAVILVLRLGAVRRPDPGRVDVTGRPGLVRLRRATTASRRGGVVVAVVVAVVVSGWGSLGRGVALAPMAFCCTLVAAVLLGDVLSSGSARTPGVAALETRRVRAYVPTALSMAVAAAGVVLVGLLAATTIVAAADDLGRAGRAYQVEYACDGSMCASATTPFPGSFYALPLVIGLAASAALTAIAAHIVVRRPRDGSDATIVAVDEAVRRRSVAELVGALGVAVGLPLAGVAGLTARSLAASPTDTAVELSGAVAAMVAVGLGLLVACWSAARLVAIEPVPRLVRREQPVP